MSQRGIINIPRIRNCHHLHLLIIERKITTFPGSREGCVWGMEYLPNKDVILFVLMTWNKSDGIAAALELVSWLVCPPVHSRPKSRFQTPHSRSIDDDVYSQQSRPFRYPEIQIVYPCQIQTNTTSHFYSIYSWYCPSTRNSFKWETESFVCQEYSIQCWSYPIISQMNLTTAPI